MKMVEFSLTRYSNKSKINGCVDCFLLYVGLLGWALLEGNDMDVLGLCICKGEPN